MGLYFGTKKNKIISGNASFSPNYFVSPRKIGKFIYAQRNSWYSTPTERSFEVGMTWNEFVTSNYNAPTDTIFINSTNQYYRGQFLLQGDYVKFKGCTVGYDEKYALILDVYDDDKLVKSGDYIKNGYSYDSMNSNFGGGN